MPSRFAPKRKPKVTDALKSRLGYDVVFDAGTPLELAKWFRYGNCCTTTELGLELKAKDSPWLLSLKPITS